MGCLFAVFGGLFPRLALLVIWLARPALVSIAFPTWILPLLGVLFFPYATLIYIVLYTPGVGLSGPEWAWVALGAVFDLIHAGGVSRRRQLAGRG
jgi:hypothetical protein